ncbi:olfactory receptor 51B6-like [Macrotis lagotis]|uniref:olfactory receptor 51B6-like n=1 Tax=Macrotis lagotis TaxID=92651 RepID=UPI003D68EA86
MWLNSSTATFLLNGFPGLEKAHCWISIPFFIVYASVILGNSTLLFLIRDDRSLHEPMYYFLAMLAATDLGVTLTTMPTIMGVLWLNHREISHESCFSQTYFIHTLSVMESGVLLIMAYDCFVAICNPLRYTSILTDSWVVKTGIVVFMRAFLSLIHLILRLHGFPYCHSHILSHTFCLHQDVIKLTCADITFNSIYPVVLLPLTGFLDSVIIRSSYIMILKMVMNIASGEERAKALNTCISHVCCVLVFYITVIGLTLIHRFGKHVPHVVHIIMSFVYFLFPPLMNPIIYSVKTKQIRNGILRIFSLNRPIS